MESLSDDYPLNAVITFVCSCHVLNDLCVQVRQLCALEPNDLSMKWKVWVADSKWGPLDLGGILIYLLGEGMKRIYLGIINID